MDAHSRVKSPTDRPRTAGKRGRRTGANAIAPSDVTIPRHNDVTKTAPSQDGDYVMLQEIREKKSQSEQKSSQHLSTIIEDIKRVDAATVHDDVTDTTKNSINAETSFVVQQEPKSAQKRKSSQDVIDKWRTKLFASAETDSITDLPGIISEANSDGVELTECVDPQNGMNAFHHSVDKRCYKSAKFFLNHGSTELLLQTFEVMVKGSAMVRNTLHLIAEKGNVELAELFTSKVGEKVAKKLMLQETATEISGQRPRTFPCLHIAAFAGDVQLTKYFLLKGTKINHLNSKNDTALLWASRWGHIEVMRLLIAKGADPNLENDKGSTALYWAVRYNLAEAVEVLAKEGNAKVDQRRKLGFVAPIVMASALGYDKIVDILIKAGADVNLEVSGSEMALHHAVREGHLRVVEILINNGAKIDDQDDSGNTPLILAARYDNADIFDMLLNNGALVTHKNHDGEGVWHCSLSNPDNTSLAVLVRSMKRCQKSGDTRKFYTRKPPLCVAATLGVIDKIEFLIDIGLSPIETDPHGNNMIHFAAKCNNHEVITKFKSCVSLDTKNSYGDTALHLACARGHMETIDVLLELKSKADIKNNRGETALHVLARTPETSTTSVTKLLEYMIKTHSWDSLHAQDNEGNHALHVASMSASTDIIWELRVLSFMQTNNHGNTPFHTAVIPGKPDVLQTILDIYDAMKRDANLNSRNNNKETVLHLATLAGDTESMTRLFTYGADLSAKDKDGNTALHRLATKIEESAEGVNYNPVIDTILDNVVRWWCIRYELMYMEDDPILFRQTNRIALRYLISEIKNNDGLTVINHSARIGCKTMLDKILMVPYVNYIPLENTARLDLTHLIPTTNIVGTKQPEFSCIEMLTIMDDLYKAGRTLDVPPLRQVEGIYANLCLWTYVVLMILHLLYMSAFSWLTVDVLKDIQTGTANTSSFYEAQTLMYVVVPIEPGIIILISLMFGLKFMIGCCKSRNDPMRKNLTVGEMLAKIVDSMTILLGFVLAVFTIAWLVLYYFKYKQHVYFLAVSLWLGWLYSISFTRGFKAVHYFWRMLKVMIMRDVTKFLFVYLFVLLAFAFAFHSMFQVSPDASGAYPKAWHTLFMTFNLMLGMVWLFEETDIETHIIDAGHSTLPLKIFVILYLILSTVVLLNVLIAMMNDSYQTIKNTQTVTWRVDSVRLGLSVEHYLPWTTRWLSSVKIHHGDIDRGITTDLGRMTTAETDETSSNRDNTIKEEDMRWFIDVPMQNVRTEDSSNADDVSHNVKLLSNRLDKLEKNVMETLRVLKDDIYDMRDPPK